MWFNKLLKATLKENKTFSVILFLLIVISVTLIVGGLSTMFGAKNTFKEKYTEYGYEENTVNLSYGITYSKGGSTEPFPSSKDERITNFLDNNKYVKSYRDIEQINLWRYSLTKENEEKSSMLILV